MSLDLSGYPLCISMVWLVEASVEWSVNCHLYKNIIQRLSAIFDKIELRKCFVNKTTIFHYKVTISTNLTPLMINSFTITSVLMSNMRHSFYNLYYCYVWVV